MLHKDCATDSRVSSYDNNGPILGTSLIKIIYRNTAFRLRAAFPVRGKRVFLFSTNIQPPIQCVKRPGREDDHSPTCSAEDKESVDPDLYSAYMSAWRGQGQLFFFISVSVHVFFPTLYFEGC